MQKLEAGRSVAYFRDRENALVTRACDQVRVFQGEPRVGRLAGDRFSWFLIKTPLKTEDCSVSQPAQGSVRRVLRGLVAAICHRAWEGAETYFMSFFVAENLEAYLTLSFLGEVSEHN